MRGHRSVYLAEDEAERFEGSGVADAWEHELGLEEREKPLGGAVAPARSGLTEVLEAGHYVESLATGFTDERGEVVDRRDVRDLVEAAEQRSGGRMRGGAAIGGMADLLEQADDERGAERLAVRGGGDVDRVRRGDEPLGVEVRRVG